MLRRLSLLLLTLVISAHAQSAYQKPNPYAPKSQPKPEDRFDPFVDRLDQQKSPPPFPTVIIPTQRKARPSVRPDDYLLLNRAISSVLEESPRRVVVRSMTWFARFKDSPYAHPNQHMLSSGNLPGLTARQLKIGKATVHDFFERNERPNRIRLDALRLAAPFETDPNQERAIIPRSERVQVLRVSLPGMNSEGTEALVYVEHESGTQDKAYLVSLRKGIEGWEVHNIQGIGLGEVMLLHPSR